MKVFVTHGLPGEYLELLAKKHEVEVWPERDISRADLLEKVKGVDAILSLLTEKMDRELMDAAGSNLKVISNYAVGFDNVDVPEATRRGIVVTNTPGVLTEAVGEHVMALMLSVVRRVAEGDRFIRAGKFKGWEPDTLVGSTVRGKTLGILGLGRIGKWTASLGCGLGMKTIYHSRSQDKGFEISCGVEYKARIEDVLQEADVLSINVPLTKETKGMIAAEQLAMMKKTAVLINTARGPVVDEADLIKALKDGVIAGAGLDVFDDETAVNPEFFEMENVVLTPHIASATVEARMFMAEMAVGNIEKVLDGEKPEALVNEEVWDRVKV